MRLPRRSGCVIILLLGSVIAARPAVAQTTQAPVSTATKEETAILEALAVNPITAPYQFETTISGGRVQLGGRVGTKVVYNEAVRIAIALGIPFDEHMVIDTAATLRAAAAPAATAAPPMAAPPVSTLPGRALAYSQAGGVPYIYPPPLFGFYDDPFYGFEPPIISYPPFWGALTRARLGDPAATVVVPGGPVPQQTTKIEETIRIPAASGREEGRVEMSVDPDGNAVVRGVVPSEAERAEVEEKLSRLPGVRSLKNEVEVRPIDEPPPPPRPAIPAEEQEPAAAAIDPAPPRGAIDPEADPEDRLQKALARRPALDGLRIHTSLIDGVATISGKVPSILEAMLAFRAVQKTPGVREVVDKLEFNVPPPKGKNPLVEQGRPDDVEPYLEAQIQRQLGKVANVDRVRVHGDQVDIRGTVESERDQPHINATLRSMPALRGFQVVAEFLPQ